MAKRSLPMQDIVDIQVNLSMRSVLPNNLNIPLYLGNSSVLPDDDRVRIYSSVAEMKDDGFLVSSPEYLAAEIYFQQTSKPRKLAVGRWDDQNEDIIDAISAIRDANGEWYTLLPQTQKEEDILALSSFVESSKSLMTLVYTTEDISLIEKLKGLNRRRSMGIITKKSPNLHVGIIGLAMGWQTLSRNSAYTLNANTLVGVETDDWTSNDLKTFKKFNANYYINRGDTYDFFEEGFMADGSFYDEIINLDYTANALQHACLSKLRAERKIPQTIRGQEIMRNVMLPILKKMRDVGFLAPGVYTGDDFTIDDGVSLVHNQMLDEGFIVLCDSIDEQVISERHARMLPAFYIFVKLAGATHFMSIQLNVDR